MIRTLALILAFVPALAAAQSAFAPDKTARLQTALSATAEGFVRPAYAAQEAAAARLRAALDAYCTGAGPRAPVEDGFADLFLAWQRSSVIQLGPVMEAEGPLRVQLWPDPKGFAAKAVRAARGAEDPALLAPGALAESSIALVNLTALEDLVQGDLAPHGYGCDLARAIAAYQHALAAELHAAWRPGAPYRRAIDSAVNGNARYPDAEAVIREFLAGIVVYTDRLRKQKIARGLGEAPGDARPKRTEAHQSGLGLASIAASFQTLADLYTLPGGVFEVAEEIGGVSEHAILARTAQSIAEELRAAPQPLAQIAEDDGAQAADLRSLVPLVRFHDTYIKTGLPGAIGMSAGFTSADGD